MTGKSLFNFLLSEKFCVHHQIETSLMFSGCQVIISLTYSCQLMTLTSLDLVPGESTHCSVLGLLKYAGYLMHQQV
jgi:hypothetical protein